MLKLAKYWRNCVVLWENLHSWQKFYTTAGRDGRDKFQVCAHVTIIAERGKVWYFSSKHIYCAVFRIDDKDKQTNHDEQSVIPQNINLAADPSCEVFLTGRQLPTKVKERHLQGTGRVLFFYWTKVWSLSSLECISARRATMPIKVQFRPFLSELSQVIVIPWHSLTDFLKL